MADNQAAQAAPTPAPVQKITVNMMTPTSGEPTVGLSETRPGGHYVLRNPDGSTRHVNAKGKPIKA